MKINVFLRSTLRQPVRTILLLLITALLTFVFVSSGAQYLLINQETEELGGYYRSIGTLTTLNGSENWTADASEAAAYLEDSPYVEYVNRAQLASAVADVYNVYTDTPDPATMSADFYFYGTFVSGSLGRTVPAGTGGALAVRGDDGELIPLQSCEFVFQIDTILTGYPYPEYFSEGIMITLRSPMGWVGMQYIGTPYGQEFTAVGGSPYADLTGLLEELQANGAGQRYLFHAANEIYVNAGDNRVSTGTGATFTIRPLTEDGLWCYPVAEGEEANFSDPALAGVAKDIGIVTDNQHSLLFYGSEDVSAMPGMQKDAAGVLTVADTFLTEGRWPNAQDNAEAGRVCAIHAQFASDRGLSVGDTLTVTFRELLDVSNAPYLCMPDDLNREDETAVSGPETYEIVGIYETNGNPLYSYLYNYVYVPASSLPQALVSEPEILNPYYLSFVLTSPEVEDQFIVETREALSDMGFQARFLPTNYDSFHAAARPLRFSALYNTVIFSMVLLVALCLVVFLYFRMRRKDVAIARALGLPVGQCVRQVSLPQLLIGLAGILAGGCAGWRYTLENAGQTLSVLSEIVEESGTAMAALSVGWLGLLLAACFALLLILTLGSAVLTAKKPVLFQLQGGMTVKQT